MTIGYHANLNSKLKINSNITASGNISSSATVTGISGSFHALQGNTTKPTGLVINGYVSASGDISANAGLITHNITVANPGAGRGDVVYFGTGATTAGKIYHYKSDGSWELADCNAAANSDGLLAVALGDDADVTGMLLRGMCTLHTIDGTEAVGDVLYLSEDTTGNANMAAPAGNGDIVRVIGYCLHASNKTIWFNPDNTFVEVTA